MNFSICTQKYTNCVQTDRTYSRAQVKFSPYKRCAPFVFETKHKLKRRICMKAFNFMMLVGSLVLTSVGVAQAKNLATGLSSRAAAAPVEVTLISRYTGGDYQTASYSFRHMSQDINVTRNNMEVLFEAREDFEDYFRVDTVVDDNSFIYDLGKRNCNDISSPFPRTNSLGWLAYSDADPSKLNPAKTAPVKVGHCYLTYNNDNKGRVVVLFRVKAHEKSKTAIIDQIDVVDVLIRQ